MDKPIVNKPEFKWYFGLPFSRVWNKGARDYHKDRDRYDDQFLTNSEKIRKRQELTINGVNSFLILIITTLWTLLPGLCYEEITPITQVNSEVQYIDKLPYWLEWIRMGGHIKPSWMEHVFYVIVPGTAGAVYHKVPNLIPQKKARFAVNVGIKVIPVLILIICTYLIFTEKKYWEYRSYEKKLLNKTLKESIEIKNPTN